MTTSRSTRSAAVAIAAYASCLGASCAPSHAPKPLDTAALPTAVTSAQPEYISSEQVADASDGAAAPDASAASTSLRPVAPDLPASVETRFERSCACRKPVCPLPFVVPDKTDEGKAVDSVNPPIARPAHVAVWQQHLDPKTEVSMARARRLGLLGVVLSGTASLAPSEGAKPSRLGPWGAFVAPGAGVSIKAGDGAAELVILAYADDGPIEPRLAALRKNPKAELWAKRPGPIVVDDVTTKPDLAWAGGAAHARLCFEQDRSPRASLGTLLLGPDVPVAEHDHDAQWEVLLAIRAKGTLEVRAPGKPGEADAVQSLEVGAGTIVTMPAGVRHAWKPDGTEPLLALQLYVPPGPEQRFKKLAQTR